MQTTSSSTAQYERGYRSIRAKIVTLVTVLLLVIWASIFGYVEQTKAVSLEKAEHGTAGIARAFEESVRRTVFSIDQALLYMRRDYETAPARFDAKAALQAAVSMHTLAVQLSIADENGFVIANSSDMPAQKVDISDREHFRVHRVGKDDTLFISKALVGRVANQWVIQFTRRLRKPDGAFAGVMILSVDPFVLSDFSATLDIGKDSIIAVIGTDGYIRARNIMSEKIITTPLTESQLFRNIKKSNSGIFTSEGYFSKQKMLANFRVLQDYPLLVFVGIPVDDVIGEYYQQGRLGVAIGLFSTVLLVWFAWTLVRRFSRNTSRMLTLTAELKAEIIERTQIEERLRIAATAFEAEVGISVTDPNSVILMVNRAFAHISGYSAEEIVGQTPRLFKSGRHDPSFYAEMWASIREHNLWQGEIWDRRKNGEVYPKWMTITAVKGQDGVTTHYVSTQMDITERKAAETEIHYLAFYDPLTRLPNRRLLLDRLHLALAASLRSQDYGALFFIDLDNFKNLNETLGHDKGDLLLQNVARRLSACIREGDTVARLGGDEFVVMLEDLAPNMTEAAARGETVGTKILATLNRIYQLEDHEHRSTVSIGVTLFGGKHETTDEILKQADMAMYQAKAAGRNALRFFDPEMQAAVMARDALETDLRNAVLEKQFIPYYQAQVQADGRLTGAEVLVRWQHPQHGLVFPDTFIPLAEETGLILPLGQAILEAACLQLVAWASRPESAPLVLAVNVSIRQFRQPDFVEQVLAILDRTRANPRNLKLELTESMLVDNVEDIIAKMTALKSRGLRFSFDDFGTGYSSLSSLKRLPLDQLKIDREFVRDVLEDANDRAIVQIIIALGQTLGLSVIAEGVETEGQRDFLYSLGCHAYQGYLFSRPLPLEEFQAKFGLTAARTTEQKRL